MTRRTVRGSPAPRATVVTPIVALDVGDRSGAERVVGALGESCRFYKVGGQLFTAEGPAIVTWLRGLGCEVFLDLKFHDIPNTVHGAIGSAAALGATLVTVHASGGPDMLSAAADAGRGRLQVLAVTVLTSLNAGQVGRAWGREQVDIRDEVLRLAGMARDAGLNGVVCGGEEASLVRQRYGDAFRTLVPGVRLEPGARDDQARVVTPAAAAAAGASWIVLGRAVTAAADPRAAMATVHEALGRAARG